MKTNPVYSIIVILSAKTIRRRWFFRIDFYQFRLDWTILKLS